MYENEKVADARYFLRRMDATKNDPDEFHYNLKASQGVGATGPFVFNRLRERPTLLHFDAARPDFRLSVDTYWTPDSLSVGLRRSSSPKIAAGALSGV